MKRLCRRASGFCFIYRSAHRLNYYSCDRPRATHTLSCDTFDCGRIFGQNCSIINPYMYTSGECLASRYYVPSSDSTTSSRIEIGMISLDGIGSLDSRQSMSYENLNMKSRTFSATMYTTFWILQSGMSGNTLASMTRRLLTPCTLRPGSTTPCWIS